MAKLKVMTILGTRPEIIRLSAVIQACDRYFDHQLVQTKRARSLMRKLDDEGKQVAGRVGL